MTSYETVNNAIVKLDMRAMQALNAGKMDVGRQKAIHRLAEHWQEYVWQRLDRSHLVQNKDATKKLLNNYVRWYTRGWVLLPESERAGLPMPADLSPKVAVDELKRWQEGLQALGKGAGDVLDDMEHVVRDVAKRAGSAADEALGTTATYAFWGLLALGGLWIWTRRPARR